MHPGADSNRGRVRWAILALILACSMVELTLVAADFGLIGDRRWRSIAYQNGAFWAGLLGNWRPNYPQQPVLMFFTYSFLHASFWHLAGNMLTLFVLGEFARDRLKVPGFLLLYILSAIGGAAVFALLTNTSAPMVGASGAIFGLFGAWQFWEWQELRRRGLGTGPVRRMVLGLIVLNAVMWFAMDGILAWETHLGGFIAGWLTAMVLSRWQTI